MTPEMDRNRPGPSPSEGVYTLPNSLRRTTVHGRQTGHCMRRGRSAGAALVLLGLALLPGAARAQYFGQNKVQYGQHAWRSISADHFDVYFYPGLDSLAMRVLDLAEKTHEYLSQRMGHSLGRRVPIILYGSYNDF